ncbi:MAG: AMP-dependent synthetase/ligase [Micrococcaceae bacterium]
MKETSTKQVVFEDENFNITDFLEKKIKKNPGYAIYSRKMRGQWVDVTIKKFQADVKIIAKSLLAQGLKPGDRVAIMSPTRYEWSLVDFAMWYAGLVSVPIFETSSRPQIEWILEDSGAKAAFVDSLERAQLVTDAARKVGQPLEHLWQFEEGGIGTNYENLLSTSDISDEELEQARSSATMNSVATLVYTSGTTGKSKGCELTHGNFVDMAQNTPPIVQEIVAGGTSRVLLFLPLAHALARAIQFIALAADATLAHSKMSNIVEDFQSFKPNWFLAVPRVMEKFYASALNSAENSGSGKIFKRGSDISIKYAEQEEKGTLTFSTKAQKFVFDKIIYAKIRKNLGGHARWVVCGGSALNPDLTKFFAGAGIRIIEGYGLTETTGPITVNTPSHTLLGSVGRPLPGVTVRIADDGEILVKGPSIFKAYWKNPEASKLAFDEDGWFKTGDLGQLEDGFLMITGRKKDVLVTAGGKNVYPTPMEEGIKASQIVDQVIVVGENKPFVSAMIILDREQLPKWAKTQGLDSNMTVDEAVENPQVIAEVQGYVDKVNNNVSRAESIRKFKIVPRSLDIESGHMTPTLKLKRAAVIKDFNDVVQQMYSK